MTSKRRRTLELSAGASTNKRTKQNKDVYDKKNLLSELTRKAGLTLKMEDIPNELSVSKTVFTKQLGTALKSQAGDLLENVEAFVNEFEEFIDDPVRFHKSLMPCTIPPEKSVQASVPDSAVRLLLGVDVIQSPLMTLLLEKLHEFQGDQDDFIFHEGQKIYKPRLLLSQFRFLDRIVDGKELSKKLLEILGTTSLDVQKEIMACIPDIVEDSEHEDIARKLRDELRSNTDLTCPIIDVLTYLNISADMVAEIRGTVLDMLKSFCINDLPIVVKFLLESVTAQEAVEVVSDIRSNVDFTYSVRLSKEEQEKVKSSIKLTIDALKKRMQFQRFIAEAWIKVLDAAKDSNVIDIFILLLLHGLNNKKAVESLMRNKIRAGLVTEALLNRAFTSFNQVVRDSFSSILSLAQALLRSPEPSICYIGCIIYKLAFTSFDTYCKQEIVDQLIMHIGSGFAGEIEASLDIIADLVKTQLQAMSRFAVFVKGVLDYLDHNNLTVTQIKKLYLLLARLAFHTAQDGSYLQDELHIIIRKQLTSDNLRYKRMGVMGAISIVHAIGAHSGSSGEEDDVLANEQYNLVISLLEMVQSSGKRSPETAALFLDSLASMMEMEKLYANIVTWIAENMIKMFEENYVADLETDADLKEKSPLPMEGMFNLNDEAESVIVVNLVPLVQRMLDKTSQLKESFENNPLCLAPLFHLVTVCEMRGTGNLDGIDALLGCPVLMFQSSVYARLDSLSMHEKDLVCTSLFLCINWFREVVNCYAPMNKPEMRGKVMKRLKHLTDLMGILKKCLTVHSTFQPPAALFDFEAIAFTSASTGPSTSGSDLSKKGKKPAVGSRGKKRKGKPNASTDTKNSTMNADESSQMQSTALSEKDESLIVNEETVDLSNYKQYFRELDFNVFKMMHFCHITNATLESETNTNKLKLGVNELQFLLEDLALKLSHALIASANRRRTFFKARSDKHIGFSNLDRFSPAQIAQKTIQILPCLCDYLEEACTFFQTQISENDGMEDGPGRFTPESMSTASCYQLLLQCILSLFTWNGFVSEENRPIFKDALKVTVKRMRISSNTCSFVSQADALMYAFKYFSNLVDTIPNLETAVILLKLLVVFVEKCDNVTLPDKLAKNAKSFLSREWQGQDGQPLKGAKHNENLQAIIKIYLEYSADSLEALETIATGGLVELVKLGKNACVEEFASLNRLTFTAYYKVVLSVLISNIKKIPAGKKNDSEEVREDRLVSWTMAVKVLQVTINLTKVFSARSNLGAALKCGRQFVEIFLRQGMPLLDVAFRRHHLEVERLLRSLQQSTRILHHLCGHSKITKDITLTNQVPTLKRALEAFVYRVKAMLSLNNCQEAFWIGNLKNKNLQGEEITSQSTVASSNDDTVESQGEEDEEEEEEGGNDDDDDDDSEVEVEGKTTQAETSSCNGSSYSEVF